MSSIELMISEIDEEYHEILKEFEKRLEKNLFYGFKAISEDEILFLLRKTMKFQRKIEITLESVTRLAEKTKYISRLQEIVNKIYYILSTEKRIDTIRLWFYDNSPSTGINEDVHGVIFEINKSHEEFLHDNLTNYRRSCYRAYFSFKLLYTDLIEMQEELRLVGALSTYPIEKKIGIKENLVSKNFEEVAISLEEAESNVEIEHFKDCVSRCRDAVEIFVSLVKEKELGEKTEKHFSIDLAKITKYGIYDDAINRLAQGIYSFLGLKGSHKYDEKKVTIYDAETALQETYSLLDMLLKRYFEYKKVTIK